MHIFRFDCFLTPTGFPNFSREWEELFLQTKLLAVDSSLGYLSMKKFHLGSEIRQRESAGGGGGWQHEQNT